MGPRSAAQTIVTPPAKKRPEWRPRRARGGSAGPVNEKQSPRPRPPTLPLFFPPFFSGGIFFSGVGGGGCRGSGESAAAERGPSAASRPEGPRAAPPSFSPEEASVFKGSVFLPAEPLEGPGVGIDPGRARSAPRLGPPFPTLSYPYPSPSPRS